MRIYFDKYTKKCFTPKALIKTLKNIMTAIDIGSNSVKDGFKFSIIVYEGYNEDEVRLD